MGASLVAQSASKSPAMARLELCSRSNIEGAVDGAWWPNSKDLGRELPDLVAVFGSVIGPVRRVVYDPKAWLSAPSRIIRGNIVIPVDPYRLVNGDVIYLIGTHSRDAVLFVVPPSSAKPVAHRVLHAVSDNIQPVGVAMLRQLVRKPAETAWSTIE